MRKLLSAFLLIILLVFSGCVPAETKNVSKTGFFFDTVISITLYGTEDTSLIDGAFELCRDYENILSRTNETSELYKLNASGNAGIIIENFTVADTEISATLSDVINKGFYYSKLSGGAFDITLEPVTSLWNFRGDNPVIPDASKITTALNAKGFDLGGIAKGYIADRIKEYLLEQGVTSAYINLGGNTLCIGTKPDGSSFRVGIQYPFKESGELIEVLNINNLSVVTAGSYNRCFTKDGVLYHHILDPKTGYPVNNNLLSVTIISEESAAGDALSTACFVLGLEEGMKLIESLDNVHAMFITDDYECHYSKDFEQFITIPIK